MSCIRKVQIGNKIYNADVEFRKILKCNEISTDATIGDCERSLAILYIIFGDDVLKKENIKDQEKLLNWTLNYMSCGNEIDQTNNDKPDMDYIEDMPYIEASFMSDYRIDLENIEMEWQKFYKLMCGLSNSELGNCCILNRIRNLRNFDVSQIKDDKERNKIIEAKKQVELKKYKAEANLTKEQEESIRQLNEMLGF